MNLRVSPGPRGAYGGRMFTTVVVWVVGLTVGYVGLRSILERRRR